MQLWRYCVY